MKRNNRYLKAWPVIVKKEKWQEMSPLNYEAIRPECAAFQTVAST